MTTESGTPKQRSSIRLGWLWFGAMPTAALALSIFLVMLFTIVLDHDILGRDPDGWPVLYKTPALRYAIDGLHLATMFLLPLAIALCFLGLGRKVGAPALWVVLGGIVVCVVGACFYVGADWTGVKGTSDLRLGLIDDVLISSVRATASMVAYVAVALKDYPKS